MAGSSGYKEYVAGLVAGVATVVTGHPFDTVKVVPLSTYAALPICFYVGVTGNQNPEN